MSGRSNSAPRRTGNLFPLGGMWTGGLNAICHRLLAWSSRARQRRALEALDDALLRDVGLTRDEIERETRKPFWRL